MFLPLRFQSLQINQFSDVRRWPDYEVLNRVVCKDSCDFTECATEHWTHEQRKQQRNKQQR